MTGVFPDTRGVACRACGAVRAPAGKHGVCGNCWDDYQHYWRNAASKEFFEDGGFLRTEVEYDETMFNQWLANRLVRTIKRASKFGVAERCQAISNWQYGRRGYQCAMPAIMQRDGRWVCHAHGRRAKEVAYVDGSEVTDWYECLESVVRQLSEADERFAQAVLTACAKGVCDRA